MITYVKIMGPPILKALKALEKIAANQPQVCIMNTLILQEFTLWGPSEYSAYFGSTAPISEERCDTIVSKSDITLGEYDFYFEWFKEPSSQQYNDLILEIDKALTPIGAMYSITTKGATRFTPSSPENIDFTVEEEEASGGYFEVYKDTNGQWRFRLKAPNHEIIAVSEAYKTKAGCLNGVGSVKENAKNSEIYDLT